MHSPQISDKIINSDTLRPKNFHINKSQKPIQQKSSIISPPKTYNKERRAPLHKRKI